MGCPIQAPPAAAPGGMASINAAVSPPGSIPTPWAGAQSAQEAPSLAPPQPPQQQQQPDAQRQQRLLQLQALLDAGQLPLDVANSVSSVLARARANGLMPPAATSAASAGTVLHNPFQQGGWVTAPMQASMQPYSSHAMHVSAWPASMGGMSQGQHHGASGMQPSYYQTNMITHGQQQMSGHMGGASMQPQAAATAGRGSGAQRKSQPSSPAKRPQGGRSGTPKRSGPQHQQKHSLSEQRILQQAKLQRRDAGQDQRQQQQQQPAQAAGQYRPAVPLPEVPTIASLMAAGGQLDISQALAAEGVCRRAGH